MNLKELKKNNTALQDALEWALATIDTTSWELRKDRNVLNFAYRKATETLLTARECN